MVGKFVFGMLSGGALVAGGFIIGSALFPFQPAIPANETSAPALANQEAVADPAPEPVAEVVTATPDPVPQAAATPPDAAGVAADAPAEATLPAAETDAAAVSESAPVEEPAAEEDQTAVPDAPAPQPEAASLPPAAPEAVAPPEVASQVEGSVPDSAPPAVAEVESPEVPPAPLLLPQLATDAVLSALDRSAAELPAPISPVAPAEADPSAIAEAPVADAQPAPPPEAAPEPLPEPVPEPVPEPAPEVAEAAPEPTPEVQPEAPTAEAMPAPEAGVAADLPGTAARDMPGSRPATLPGTEITEAAPDDVVILPEADSAATPVVKPAPGLGNAADGVVVGRLPRIGDAPAAEAAAPEADPQDLRPIAQFAATFENPDGKPALAIVLIDPGTDDLDRAGLAALPFPVSFALDPLDSATPERAAIYRAAGKEVVMLAIGIADGAQASDVEVSFQSMAQGLPEAVAVMDLPDPVFQNARTLASIVVPVIGAQGRGLLTWDQGLNAADQVARREDIPAAVVFRDLGSAGEDSADIRRVLDRAVFKAGQDGRVALAGTASAATVAALLEWTVEGRAATVALAPLTAVMTVE